MEVFMEVNYDPLADPDREASKLDKFRQRLYPLKARWERVGEGKLVLKL